jgi:hypothetical protein
MKIIEKGEKVMKTSILLCVSLIVMMFVATGCYEVVYTAEYKGDSCIKFEDAMYEIEPDVWVEACLGEDGAVEADAFYAELEGDVDPEEIVISVKAGKCKDNNIVLSDQGDYWEGDGCGFTILGLPIPDEDGWLFGVISDDIEGGKDGTAALSNITFCFGEGVTVIGPEEGEFPTYRAEGEEEIEEIIDDILDDINGD